jgi:hypothetical protein
MHYLSNADAVTNSIFGSIGFSKKYIMRNCRAVGWARNQREHSPEWERAKGTE